MAIPLTAAVILLGLLVFVLCVVVLRQSRQIVAMTRHHEARTDKMIAYYDKRSTNQSAETRLAITKLTEYIGDVLKSQPDITDKTTRMISEAVSQIAKSVTEGMKAVYAPMQTGDQTGISGSIGDAPTPWYADEKRGLDYSDPTDFMDGVGADGNEYQGPIIQEGDDEPFGIPGLGIDPATNSGSFAPPSYETGITR